jgi:transcriptional regulator with XRE-family HTH domain
MLATLSKKLLRKLSRKEYRVSYVEQNVRTGVAYQIRALREQRGWTQTAFGRLIGAGQSTASRLEDPDYGKMSISSLLQVASACDVALLVRFVSFEEMILRSRDVSPEALQVSSWNPSKFRAADEAHVVTAHLPKSPVSGEASSAIVRRPQLEVSSS